MKRTHRKKKKRNANPKTATTSSKRRFPVICVVLGSVGLAIAAIIYLYHLRHTDSHQANATTDGESCFYFQAAVKQTFEVVFAREK